MNRSLHSSDADPEQLVSELLTAIESSGTYPRERVARLAQLASSEDRQVAERASGAFFGSLVEPLADSFEPAGVSLYNQAFAQLIDACRKTERGRPIDQQLTGLGLPSEADVLARAGRLRARLSGIDYSQPTEDMLSRVSRIIVLSRVTLGADVAITSLMIERFKTAFPQAEIVLVGGSKASELFGGDARLEFKTISYPRAATALDKLLTWLPLLDCVRQLTDGVERCLIVDPDSRLSQLGLLPLTPRAGTAGSERIGYCFFPSREYGHESSASLSELTSVWLDELFGRSQPDYPTVSLARVDLEAARSIIGRIKRDGHPVVAVNFGVGGNQAKRVGDDFESQLVSSLLQDGATVVIDKGAGVDEEQRAQSVIEFAKRASIGPLRSIELDETSLSGSSSEDRIEAELVVFIGRVGLLAALISESDLYIGYDSAGQHIAAALGVSCIDVFAGFNSRRMLDRWRPTGRAETRVIAVEQSMTESDVLAETLGHARQSLGGRV
ncbi:MAG TPA: hypothetical protein VNS63_19150 [Blastocatellia bacterium]|nr:hypothetical protein [Blastocatellia bacterium]